MREKLSIDTKNPNRATCKMFAQSGGRGFFAEVTVCVVRVDGNGATEFSGNEFLWLKDVYGPDAWEWSICGEFREGAIFGVQWARDHAGSKAATAKVDITIERIGASPTDTDRECCAYVACLATWAALGIDGSIRPFVKNGSISFPDQ